MSDNCLSPRAVLSKMDDFLATARAKQARPRQQRPDKAGQKQARQSKPDVHKTPRLYRKIAKRRPGARQTKQAKSKQEPRQEQTKAGQKQARSRFNRPVYLVNCTKVGPRKVGNKRQRRGKSETTLETSESSGTIETLEQILKILKVLKY